MKIRKDVAFALMTMAAVIVALFTFFVSIPTWFEAVVITLACVGLVATISSIVKADKASYNEELGERTYRFPVWTFIIGTLIIAMVAAVVLLSLLRLFGFALIPFALLLLVLLVIALQMKSKVASWIFGILFVLLVVAIVGYFTSAMVHNGIDINPGNSVETTAPDNSTPETETTAPNTEKTETEKPETEEPETEKSETEEPETEKSETEEPETEKSETEEPETEKSETEEPETEKSETEEPETEKSETEETETEEPENDTPVVETPETPVVEYKYVHLKVYLPKVINYGDSIRVTVEGVNAHDLEFEYGDAVSVDAVSDTELTITVKRAINIGNIEYTVNDAGHYVILDSEAHVEYTIEVINLEDQPVIPEQPKVEDEDDKEVEDKPVEDVEKPGTTTPEVDDEETETTPTVEVKINAPETIVFAEPITITLEGCKAENIIFGNEDFLSIVIVSESEIEVTLVGIVNDSGEVEFVPAAGYITVTDSVSGKNVSIEIVEKAEPDVEIPEVTDPEIENNDEDVVDEKPVEDVEKPETEKPKEEYTPVYV